MKVATYLGPYVELQQGRARQQVVVLAIHAWCPKAGIPVHRRAQLAHRRSREDDGRARIVPGLQLCPHKEPPDVAGWEQAGVRRGSQQGEDK